jgi:DNA-binding response OmpR family regulator
VKRIGRIENMNKILIVDDDNEFRASLSELLKGKGYSTDEASSGEEAIEKAASEDFDIILLDLMMPKMSGMDVLVEVRKIKPETKIIMITAFATIDNAVEAIKKGASDYISKPFRIEVIDTAIKRILEAAEFDKSAKRLGLDYALSSLSNYLRREIIKLIDLNKGMRLMEMTRILDINDHTKVSFHLKMLKDSGIIEQKKKTYFLTKEGDEILTCLRILESHLSQ